MDSYGWGWRVNTLGIQAAGSFLEPEKILDYGRV